MQRFRLGKDCFGEKVKISKVRNLGEVVRIEEKRYGFDFKMKEKIRRKRKHKKMKN